MNKSKQYGALSLYFKTFSPSKIFFSQFTSTDFDNGEKIFEKFWMKMVKKNLLPVPYSYVCNKIQLSSLSHTISSRLLLLL